MCLANGRKVKFVFGVMWMNEVVGNLMRQREVPRKQHRHQPGSKYEAQ